MSDRTTIVFQIAEVIAGFKAEEVDGKWRVRDRIAGAYLDADYTDEANARTGAHLAAALAIRDRWVKL